MVTEQCLMKNHTMQNKKDIRSRNDKGIPHGYWETYNDNTLYKRYYINFEKYGLEVYDNTEKLSYKSYYAR
jgi:hypothetical protein